MIVTCNSEGEAVSNAWDEFVFASPSATISHLYAWRRIIGEAYGHRCFFLTERREDKITAILPLVQVKSWLFGNSLCSMPFQDYGGIVTSESSAEQSLLNYALRLKSELEADSLELRNCDLRNAAEAEVRQDKATLILNISAGSDVLWKSFSPKLRNQIRKAQKSGLRTGVGGSELLVEFYEPFAVNMRDLGSPVHHPKFFQKIFSEFGNKARVLIVREGKQAIGGLIALFHKDRIVIPWASSLRRHLAKCPNNILYWDAIQYACDRGCQTLDFGRSSIGSGTYNFKLQWGAQPVQLHWQVFSENNHKAAAENGGLRMVSSIWKHVPASWANFGGPYLRKYLTN